VRAEPRFGRLYSATVLRPLAEQLVAELGVRPGETVCDLLCDSGMLGATFAGAVGNTGRVVPVDSDVALPNAGSCDRVGSLCTLGFWTGASMLEVALRITRPGGVAAVLTWDPDDPPAHERALLDALRDVMGIDSPFLRECLAAPAADESHGWEIGRLHDVVRFDGIAQYWVAMVLERPWLAEVDGASEPTVSALRRACEARLRPCIAADGTMRIPVTATMWRRTRGIGD
jgi:SAM-dependent methyltransferase